MLNFCECTNSGEKYNTGADQIFTNYSLDIGLISGSGNYVS